MNQPDIEDRLKALETRAAPWFFICLLMLTCGALASRSCLHQDQIQELRQRLDKLLPITTKP